MIRTKKGLIKKLNAFGDKKTPCLFILNFDATKGYVYPLEECAQRNIFYEIKGRRNFYDRPKSRSKFTFEKEPLDFETYEKGFNIVQKEINKGNTYLLNLTYPTPIKCSLSLKEIFTRSNAKFKLFYKDKFEFSVRIDK